MKCLQVHNDYLVPGGETTSAKLIADELERNGVEVIRYYKHNKEINSNIYAKFKNGIKSIFNFNTVKEISDILNNNTVDFAIVHNTSPLISNSIFYILSKKNIPILKYVQNYNLLCMNGSKNVDEKICNKCITSSGFNSLRYKCYKNSYIFTLLKLINKKVFDKYFKNKITNYVAISHFVKMEHIKYNFDSDNFKVIYHFIDKINPYLKLNSVQKYFLYMGRLSEEKGIKMLLDTFNANPDKRLKMIGDGPMSEEVKKFISSNNCSNIEYLGFKSGKEKDELVKNALSLLVPSDWDEPFGRIVIESYSMGTPVISSNRGGLGELVEEGITGYKFSSKNMKEFSQKISNMWDLKKENHLQLRNNCIKKCHLEFSNEAYIAKLMNLISASESRKAL